MIPESIKSQQIVALDTIWANRLDDLGLRRILLDIENTQDPLQLDLLLEQFGVPSEVFDFSVLTTVERSVFLQKITQIYELSGTEKSIIELCKALGATDASISYDWALYYNDELKLDGSYYYDGGERNKLFAVSVMIQGITNHSVFANRLQKAFEVFQPVRIYLSKMSFI